ncbi:hypothetical protein sos41_33850 [Alphaproteobacteria bacterium SO-S41]|nr:hypothetical protein sos41_33850 [Alphaproteobacteria bacterium SO-S41]
MPPSVQTFERLMFVTVAIAIGGLTAAYLQFASQLSSEEKTDFALIASCLVILTVALTLLASRGRSKIARGILLGLLALSVFQLLRDIGAFLADGIATALVQLVQLGLQGYAISRLFTDEAKAYLDGQAPPT